MRKFILLFLITLVHKSTQDVDPNDKPTPNYCADCKGLEQYKSHINTGHYCHKDDNEALAKNFTQGNSMYPRCVPSMYQVVIPVRQFCCFWSPQMGCTALIGEKHYERFGIRCSACTKFCLLDHNGASCMNYGHLTTIPMALTFLALLKMLIPLNHLGYHDEWGLYAEA